MSRLLLAVLTLAAFTSSVAAADPSGSKPNIIVIFTDDHGWADLGVQGIETDLRTPHLDSLAAGGVRAVSGYVTAPQCVPSRAGLLTGRSQNRFGVESNSEPVDGFNGQTTIAERLKAGGYATGMAGKWHLGPPQQIVRHGFDSVYANNGGPSSWSNYGDEGQERQAPTPWDEQYHIDANSAAACDFVARHKSQPFFYYLAYRAPHVPLDAPRKYLDRFPGEMPHRRRQCLAMLSAVDDGVGRLLAELRKQGLEEKTLIFVIGDNGAPLKIHKLDEPGGGPGWDGSLNHPMNGEKGMLSEGGIRVPWLAYWKGTIPAGQTYEQPVISLDVAATAAALAGVQVSPGELDGVNLLPHFTGNNSAAPHDKLCWRWIAQSAIRAGHWKLLIGGPREYLFDLSADPGETNNLIREHPEVAERLRSQLKSWSQELQPPGLAAGPMAKAADAYFDHYLDGKPAAPPNAEAATAAADWVLRNGTFKQQPDGLRIIPGRGGKQRPFIAVTGFKVASPMKVTAELRSPAAGPIGLGWRCEGQQSFLPDQTVSRQLLGTSEFQQVTFDVLADAPVIHIRLTLPAESVELRRLEVTDGRGRVEKQWSFGATPPAAEERE